MRSRKRNALGIIAFRNKLSPLYGVRDLFRKLCYHIITAFPYSGLNLFKNAFYLAFFGQIGRLIPNWDIFIIPLWYTFVKGVLKIFRLKELREKRRISQVRLAIELDLNQNSISRYENGAREADYRTLLAFADYFNVSLDYLFGRTDNPEINK